MQEKKYCYTNKIYKSRLTIKFTFTARIKKYNNAISITVRYITVLLMCIVQTGRKF